MRRRVLLLGVAVVASAASAGHAETGQRGDGREFGIGLGAGSASMSVGDESKRTFGASIIGRIGLDSRNRVLLIAEFSPLGVDNPVADESFRAFNVLLGLSIGRSFKVRPSLGWQFRFWSGSQKVEGSDSGLVLGLDVGPEIRLNPKLSLSPEAVLRLSQIEFEGSVSGGFIGVQLVASWRGSGR
jgi:hypothetical protein